MDILHSINGVPIRFTDERWVHIVENHDDLAGFHDEIVDIIEYPEYIIKGYKGALIALRQIKKGKFLCVIYKEISAEDGFVITAYFSSKISLGKEDIIWQQQKQPRH
ncbi:MAG: hypothetical protein COX19_04660 [Desulfobacterales bacterium CG23_combo_of_CG06-09_8_20_14_all_51_8]|nr:MAG: hypothetical protein COX19_04660 [Desulfobacterales bacterium CG23_combo_of_CG06-09_8_20_14_all_51_8]